MRKLIVALVLIGSVASTFGGKLPPLGLKDISLMLRSGYSLEAVQREVATRHFIEPINPASEKSLLQAGATAAFVEQLKSGDYSIPPEEIAAAQEEIAAQAKRRALQAEEARKLDTLYQHQQVQARAAAAARAPSTTGNVIATAVKGDLVTSKNGILSTYNDQVLEKKKLIGLYFSAHWCGPCRKFTPQLVEYYNRVASTHAEFEIVFVSADRSGPAMETYMRDMQMPWPALKFEKVAENLLLRKYAGAGIPCLVLVDADGKIVADSYDGKTYLGPEKVLAALDQIFAGGTGREVAQQR